MVGQKVYLLLFAFIVPDNQTYSYISCKWAARRLTCSMGPGVQPMLTVQTDLTKLMQRRPLVLDRSCSGTLHGYSGIKSCRM